MRFSFSSKKKHQPQTPTQILLHGFPFNAASFCDPQLQSDLHMHELGFDQFKRVK